MANEWYKDDEKMSYFVKALENKLKEEYRHYDIIIDDWEWYVPKTRKTDEQYLEIRGNVSGESSYSCNQRDVDDFDTEDFDFDLPLSIGNFPESVLKENTKQQFFEMMVKDAIHEIESAIEDQAEYECERRDDWKDDPDRYRDD